VLPWHEHRQQAVLQSCPDEVHATLTFVEEGLRPAASLENVCVPRVVRVERIDPGQHEGRAGDRGRQRTPRVDGVEKGREPALGWTLLGLENEELLTELVRWSRLHRIRLVVDGSGVGVRGVGHAASWGSEGK
jgi:hypothetical protein